MDKQEYVEKVHLVLADEVTHEKLKSDLTSKYKNKLIGMLSKLLEEKNIGCTAAKPSANPT